MTGKAPANIKVVNDRDATISVEGTKADFNLYLGVPLEIEGLDGYTQIQPISNDNLTGLFRYVRVLFPDDKVYSNLYKYATEYPNGLRICKASDDTSRGKLGETLPVLVGKRCGLGAISQAKYEGKSPLVAQCQGDSAACDKIMQTVKVEVLPYEYKDNSPVITPIPNPIVNPIIGKDPIPSPKAYEILPSSVKYNPENYIYKDSGLANCGAVDIDNNGKVDSDEMQLLFALESKKCDTRSYLPKEVTSTCGIRDINFSEGIDVNDLDTAMVRLDNRDKCIYFSVIDRQLQPLFCKSIDTNNNGLYDIAEFSSIRENFGRACQNVAPRGKCGTADINNDGLVNVTDFSLFSSNIGKSCATTQPRLVCGALDVNADNKINYTDYHYLSKNFGKTCEDIITTDSLFGLLDVNADKLINVTDFSNLAKYYGKEVMPEPVGTN